MPTYTVEAFRWTGTYYNSQYNTSYTMEITDDDGSFQGGSDSNETISIDGSADSSSNSAPYAIDVSFTDTSGSPQVETFYFVNTSAGPGGWFFIPGPGSEFTVGATLGTYQSHSVGWDYDTVTCFVAGTLIETPMGPRKVEELEPGASVSLAGGGVATLRLNLSSNFFPLEVEAHETLRPVRIAAGALGAGLPKRDLLVSRQHRMEVASPIAKRMFGEDRVLIAAIRLTELPGIYVDQEIEAIAYHHLVFDEHEVVVAEGAPSESFYPGPEALEALSPKSRAELFAMFPELENAPEPFGTALTVPKRKAQIRLVARHLKNEKALLADQILR